MSLQEEIDQLAKEIHTDAYAMSIGEAMNLYAEGELDIHPEFQRFFRWSPKQKSRLIESILLGIPVPWSSSLSVRTAFGMSWTAFSGSPRSSSSRVPQRGGRRAGST